MSNISHPSDFGGKPQIYFKRNYSDVVESIVPGNYLQEDINLSGLGEDVYNDLINSHIIAAENISDLLGNTEVNSLSGIAPYFNVAANRTDITPYDFEIEILAPLKTAYSKYKTKDAFISYLSGTLLPTLAASSTTLHTDTSSVFGNSLSATRSYLTNSLSWFWFLNTGPYAEGGGNGYAPSSTIIDVLGTLYDGDHITITDGVKCFQEYLWRNNFYPEVDSKLVVDSYTSGVGTWTSGTQNLEKLKTLVGIIYSSDRFNIKDTFVRDAFESYEDAGLLEEGKIPVGPMHKFLRAISYGLADNTAEADLIKFLYDIERCPEELLPYMADLIGWNLLGNDTRRWRTQLRHIVSIYKRKGTKESIQTLVNLVFGSDTVAVSGDNLYELYESYIPNLIYYALATDSILFKNRFRSWTPEISRTLGVQNYSYEDMDLNLRYAVDTIIYDLTQKFPDHFKLGDKFFNEHEKFIFYYRGRNFPMPPWEEERYYEHTGVSTALLERLKALLLCFGVRKPLREALIDYINKYVSRRELEENESILYIDNAWLFFTSGLEQAPNYAELLSNPSEQKIEYLSLWNGKSSHFALPFYTSSFDFEKLDIITKDSGLAIREVAHAIDQVVPAHAIPKISLTVSTVVDSLGTFEIACPNLAYYSDEVFVGSGDVGRNYAISGSDSTGHTFVRTEADNIDDYQISTTSVISAPRASIRRRNYKHLLPHNGAYYRGGDNMPPLLSPSALEKSISDASNIGWIPLGYTPSAARFQEASDVHNLHPVYDPCENLGSSSTYFDIDVSNTFPCRGGDTQDNIRDFTFSGCHEFTTRGETPEIIVEMHKLLEKKQLLEASAYYQNQQETRGEVTFDVSDVDFITSYANVLGSSVSSYDVYEDFKFGRGIHKLYHDYAKYFNKHELNKHLLENQASVPNIFSHTYGPLVYNANFEKLGKVIDKPKTIVGDLVTGVEQKDPTASSVADNIEVVSKLTGASGNVFTNDSSGMQMGTYVASDSTNLYVNDYEFRNDNIIDGVDLIYTSGVSPEKNYFSIIKVAPEYAKAGSENFLINNTLIKLASDKAGSTRIKFDLKNKGYHEEQYSVSGDKIIYQDNNNGGVALMVIPPGGSVSGQTLTFSVYAKVGKYSGKYTPGIRVALFETSGTDKIFDGTYFVSGEDTSVPYTAKEFFWEHKYDSEYLRASITHTFSTRFAAGGNYDGGIGILVQAFPSDEFDPVNLNTWENDDYYYLAQARLSEEDFLNPSWEDSSTSNILGDTSKPNDSFDATDFNRWIKQTGTSVSGDLLVGPIAASAQVGPTVSNLLIPEHEYELTVRAAGLYGEDRLAPVPFGVWIHTDDEEGKYWYPSPSAVGHDIFNYDWRQADTSTTNSRSGYAAVAAQSYVFTTTLSGEGEVTEEEHCILGGDIDFDEEGIITDNNFSYTAFSRITASMFRDYVVKFSTRNLPLALEDSYYINHNQIHRGDQNYNIEIFTLPTAEDSYLIVDSISLKDITLNERTNIPVANGNIPISKQELLPIIRYFNDLSNFKTNEHSITTINMAVVGEEATKTFLIPPADNIGRATRQKTSEGHKLLLPASMAALSGIGLDVTLDHAVSGEPYTFSIYLKKGFQAEGAIAEDGELANIKLLARWGTTSQQISTVVLTDHEEFSIDGWIRGAITFTPTSAAPYDGSSLSLSCMLWESMGWSTNDYIFVGYAQLERGGLSPWTPNYRTNLLVSGVDADDYARDISIWATNGPTVSGTFVVDPFDSGTSSVHGLDGGSRLNYRAHPDWYSPGKNSNFQVSSLVFDDL